MLCSDVSLGVISGLQTSDFLTDISAFAMYPMYATCPAHSTLLHTKTLTIFVEKYKLLSPSLGNFLHFHLVSFLLVSNILSSNHNPCYHQKYGFEDF
jgi:hypothetical protein